MSKNLETKLNDAMNAEYIDHSAKYEAVKAVKAEVFDSLPAMHKEAITQLLKTVESLTEVYTCLAHPDIDQIVDLNLAYWQVFHAFDIQRGDIHD